METRPTSRGRTALNWLRTWWVFLPLLSIGLLAWAPFVYVGLRTRRRAWLIAACVYAAFTVVALMFVSAAHAQVPVNRGFSDAGGFVLIALMGGGSIHAMAIRNEFLAAIGADVPSSLETAQHRIRRQAEARRIAREDPVGARRLGIGRPDLADAYDAALVDLNSAPADVIAEVAGIELETAARIVDARQRTGDFSSVEDLDLLLDLPPGVVARLKDTAVCLPTD